MHELLQYVQDCLNAEMKVTDSTIVELSLKMALIFEKLGRFPDTETGFQFCIHSQEQKLTNSDNLSDRENEEALLGMCYDNYAK